MIDNPVTLKDALEALEPLAAHIEAEPELDSPKDSDEAWVEMTWGDVRRAARIVKEAHDGRDS